jgi:hypothetical protein
LCSSQNPGAKGMKPLGVVSKSLCFVPKEEEEKKRNKNFIGFAKFCGEF